MVYNQNPISKTSQFCSYKFVKNQFCSYALYICTLCITYHQSWQANYIHFGVGVGLFTKHTGLQEIRLHSYFLNSWVVCHNVICPYSCRQSSAGDRWVDSLSELMWIELLFNIGSPDNCFLLWFHLIFWIPRSWVAGWYSRFTFIFLRNINIVCFTEWFY